MTLVNAPLLMSVIKGVIDWAYSIQSSGCLPRGDKEVEVSLAGSHLVGALPDVEGVELLPQGSQQTDMLAGHALVNEHPVPDGGVPSGSADEPLEADVPKARVHLGCGAPRAREEPVTAVPDLCQGINADPGIRWRESHRVPSMSTKTAWGDADSFSTRVGTSVSVIGSILSQCE